MCEAYVYTIHADIISHSISHHTARLSSESISLHIVNIVVIMITLRFSFKSFPIRFLFDAIYIFRGASARIRVRACVRVLSHLDSLSISWRAFISAIIIYLINTITWLSHFLIAAHIYLYVDIHVCSYCYSYYVGWRHSVDFNRNSSSRHQPHMSEWVIGVGRCACAVSLLLLLLLQPIHFHIKLIVHYTFSMPTTAIRRATKTYTSREKW